MTTAEWNRHPASDAATLRRVRAEQDRYSAIAAQATQRLVQRDAAIVAAIRAGIPYLEIVEATGLTMPRLSQLKRAAEQADRDAAASLELAREHGYPLKSTGD